MKLPSVSCQLLHRTAPPAFNLIVYLVHYLFPPSRGASSLVSDVIPCQGYELGNRISYPISGGTISWAGIVSVYGMEFRYSTSENPGSQDDFSPALTNVTKSLRGQTCIPGPDFDDLGLDIGQNVTLQMYYEAGPTRRPNVEVSAVLALAAEALADSFVASVPTLHSCRKRNLLMPIMKQAASTTSPRHKTSVMLALIPKL